MAARLLHRAVSSLFRCRAAPLPTLQRSACHLHNTQTARAPLHLVALDVGACVPLNSRPRCLATKAAAREVASEIEDDGDDLDDELEDFEELVTEESVGRQIVVGDADWCSFLVLHAEYSRCRTIAVNSLSSICAGARQFTLQY